VYRTVVKEVADEQTAYPDFGGYEPVV